MAYPEIINALVKLSSAPLVIGTGHIKTTCVFILTKAYPYWL